MQKADPAEDRPFRLQRNLVNGELRDGSMIVKNGNTDNSGIAGCRFQA
jgi:hypothetical protein